MWIALGILAAVIIIGLCLPVHICLRVNEKTSFSLQLRYLWLTFDADSSFGNAFKKETKAPKADSPTLQDRIHTDGLGKTLSDTYAMLTRVLKAAVKLLGKCTLRKLHIKIRCGGEDAAVAAIHYGQYNAMTHGFLNALQAFLKIQKKNCRIDIACDFGGKNQFSCDADLRIRAGQALPVIIQYLWNELKIKNKKEEVK